MFEMIFQKKNSKYEVLPANLFLLSDQHFYSARHPPKKASYGPDLTCHVNFMTEISQ